MRARAVHHEMNVIKMSDAQKYMVKSFNEWAKTASMPPFARLVR